MNFKRKLKNFIDNTSLQLFKHRKQLSFLKYYPRARNYIYDIINFRENNDLKCIFDVGANIGQSAIYYRRLFKKTKINCFEPIVDTYSSLLKNTLKDENIHCYNFALGADNNNLTVEYVPNSVSNSITCRHL